MSENLTKINNCLKTKNVDWKNINEVATKCHVSTSALTRFAKSKGFSGFKELKFFYKNKNPNIALSNLTYSLARTNEQINNDVINFIATKIVKKGKVTLLGEGFSLLIAEFFQRKLRKINIDAHLYNLASDMSLIIPNQKMIYIFFSNSGKNPNIEKIYNKIALDEKQRGIIFSITSSGYSNIEKVANETIKGYSFFSEDIDEHELPENLQMVGTHIVNMIFKRIYKLNNFKNRRLIDQIKIKK